MEYMQTKPKPSKASVQTPGVPSMVPLDGTPVSPIHIHVPTLPTQSGRKDWSTWGVLILLCFIFSGGVGAYVARWSTARQLEKIEEMERRIERQEKEWVQMKQQVTRLETKVERLER